MELFEFTKAIKELCDFYERAKEPRQGTIELWFDRVRQIPSEPVPWIIGKIEENSDTFPRNLPGALWAGFREWSQAYPEKMAPRVMCDCPDCTDGILWARAEKNGQRYSYIFRCARCKQSNTEAYPMASRTELMADYEVMPRDGWPYEPRGVRVVNQPADRTLQIEHIDPVICRQPDEKSTVIERFRSRVEAQQ